MESISQKTIIACLSCKSLYRVPSTLMGKPVTCKKCRRTFLAAEAQINVASPEKEGSLLCKIALNYGFVTEKKLENILKEYTRQKHMENSHSLEEILISHGGLDDDNVDLLKSIRDNWDLRVAEKQFAFEAVNKGFISKDKAREALVRQAQMFKESRKICLLCDILTESGDLAEGQCDQILKNKAVLPQPRRAILHESPPQPQPLKTASKPMASPRDEVVKPEKPSEPLEDVEKNNTNANMSASGQTHLPQQSSPQDKQVPAEDTDLKDIEPAPNVSLEPQPETTVPDSAQETKVPDIPEPEAGPVTEKQVAVQEAAPNPLSHQTDSAPSPVSSDLPDTISPAVESRSESEDRSYGPIIIPVSGLELIIAPDLLTATLKVPEGVDDPSKVSVKDIMAALAEEEIIEGISEESLIKGFLNSKIFREKPFKVAEGVPPKPGKKGDIKFYFDTDYLKIGAISETGQIDFKDRGEIPFVTEGTLLAEITPSIPGHHGKDIYGRDIPVQEIQEVYLRCDTGTRTSENGLKIYAAIDGQPKLNFGNRLSVLSELTIPGDVGFETGHVEFEGNIMIKGTVQSDFIVKGANITATEVTGATLIAKGDVEVKNGISNSDLTVEGNIQAKFIHKSTISAYGNVIVDKEIIDCDIGISGILSTERGKIISSTISAKLGVEAMEIGTDMSNPCRLKIGVDDHIEKEADLIDDLILNQKTILADYEQKLSELEEQEKETHKTITELAHIQDRSQLEQKELNQKLDELKQAGDTAGISDVEVKIAELSQKARDADNAINENFDGQDRILDEIKKIRESIIECKDDIYDLTKQKKDKLAWAKNIKAVAYVKTGKQLHSGTVISGKHVSKTLKENIRNTRIREIKSPESAEGWEIKIA